MTQTVKELRDQLEAAIRAEAEAGRAADRAKREAWEQTPRVFEVTPRVEEAWHGRRAINGAWIATEINHNGERGGMFYYRTSEGILTHCGGGHHVLDSEPHLCSNAEWAQLMTGDIPTRFLRRTR